MLFVLVRYMAGVYGVVALCFILAGQTALSPYLLFIIIIIIIIFLHPASVSLFPFIFGWRASCLGCMPRHLFVSAPSASQLCSGTAASR